MKKNIEKQINNNTIDNVNVKGAENIGDKKAVNVKEVNVSKAKATSKKSTVVDKSNVGTHSESGRPWFAICAIDAGYGFMKVDVKDASSANSEHIFFTQESSVAPYESYTNKVLLSDTIVINNEQYVVKSGKRVGERTDNGASTKNNIYTISNIYYALLEAYKRTGRDTFKLGVGVTTDIYEDGFDREDYRNAILGNDRGEGKPDLNGEITFKYFEDEEEKTVVLKIKHLSIYPEGVCSLYREKKIVERSYKQRVWIVDIGTRTNHIIPISEGNYDTVTNPFMNGYVSLMDRIGRAMKNTTGRNITFRDADKEFKLYIKDSCKNHKADVEKGINQYLKLIHKDMEEEVGVDFANDAFFFIGGTSARIKPYITKYLEEVTKVDSKNIIFSNNCFYANCAGIYSSLISTLRAEVEKAKQEKMRGVK